jgi:adenine-specific DNA methylase
MLEELRATPVSELQAKFRVFSRENPYNYHDHVQLADDLEDDGKLPASFMVVAPGSQSQWIWDDVNRMRTLNGDQARKELAMHICPLQFDIVERIIERFSNKGELVFDPFAGLSTVPYMAVKMGRRGIGTELNPESWHDGLVYLKAADMEVSAPTLFDF